MKTKNNVSKIVSDLLKKFIFPYLSMKVNISHKYLPELYMNVCSYYFTDNN